MQPKHHNLQRKLECKPKHLKEKLPSGFIWRLRKSLFRQPWTQRSVSLRLRTELSRGCGKEDVEEEAVQV
jgi:hypothetical protein